MVFLIKRSPTLWVDFAMRPMHSIAAVNAFDATRRNDVNLRRLQHVVALAETVNFARAADSVNLSQPAFSRSIQALERELGVALFDRTERRAHLTAYGKLFVERAKMILAEERELRRDVDMMKHYELGEVFFGTGPYPASGLLVPILKEMIENYPKLCIRVEVAHWPYLLELLQAEKLEFVIADTREVMDSPIFAVTPLPQLRLSCYCRAGHPLLSKKDLSVTDLASFPLASVTHPQSVLIQMARELNSTKQPEKLFALECGNLFVAEELALRTDMILVAPQPLAGTRARKNPLIEIKPKHNFIQHTHFGVITLKHRTTSPAAAIIIKMAQAILAESLTAETGVAKPKVARRRKQS